MNMDEVVNGVMRDLTLPHIPRSHALYAAFSLGKLAHAASTLSPDAQEALCVDLQREMETIVGTGEKYPEKLTAITTSLTPA
jgi:hypothetical protein